MTEPGRSTRQYPDRPIVGVGAVIMRDGEVLLVKRRFEPLAGTWSLPGGTVEVGETLEAGLRREMREETGLDVEIGPVIEVFDRIMLDDSRRVQYHFVLIDYLCWPVGGRLAAGSDVEAAIFVHPSRLEPYKVTEKAQAVITAALELSRIRGRVASDQ